MSPQDFYAYLYDGSSLNSLLSPFLPWELCIPPLDEIDCNGFLSHEELARLVAALRDQLRNAKFDDLRLVDLGCGSGGLAKYLARHLERRTIGIDRSPLAIARALADATTAAVEFRVADFVSTGLPESSVAAIISLDALYLAADPRSALAEAHRITCPGGALLFSAYETVDGSEFRVEEWCDTATSVGFTVIASRNRTAHWRSLMRRKHSARWNARQEVCRFLGERAAAELQVSATMLGFGRPSFLDATERYEIEFAKKR